MAGLNVKGMGDFSSIIKASQDTARALADMGVKAAGIANPFNIAASAIGGTVNALGKIGMAALGVEALGKSGAAMAEGLLQGNAALEMTTISFKTLLGSAGAADDMIKQLTTFAAQTPFNLPGLEASTQKLLAFGFTSKDIIPMMTSLGDAISALGGSQDNLNSLVYVMGQMHQEAHINAGDIMQMVNQGIPALQMLADHYGKTTSQIQEMITKGLIPGQEAVDIFQKGLEAKYGGMMVAQSSTFNGMLSNLQDWATQTTITLTKPFFEPAKKALAAFLAFVQSPQGVAVINHMAADIQMAVDKATAAFIRFEPQIKPALERLLKFAEAVRGQMTPGIITLIPIIEKLWIRFEPLALSVWKVYQAIQPLSIALAALKGFASGGVTGALDALRDRFNMLADYAKKGFAFVLEEARKFGPELLGWVGRLAVDLERQALKWGSALVDWVLPQIPRLLNFLLALGGSLISWVLGEIPVLARYLLQMASAFVDWVLPIIPRVLNTLGYLAAQVVGWITAEAPVLTRAILDWATILIDWVLPQVPKLLNALGRFGTEVLKWVEKEGPILTRNLLKWTDILAGWIIPAIPGVLRALEVVGAAIVNWGITRLPVLIGEVIVGIGEGFGVNLQGPVNDVLKVFNSLVANIKNVVLPAFFQMVNYLSINLMPLFDRLANFTARTIIPTLASLAAFIMTTVVPVFVNIADILGRLFGPALTTIGDIIRNQLLPALSDSWTMFDGKYMPTVKDLASALGEKLADGIKTVADRFKDAWPHVETFYKKIEPIVSKALDLYKAISPLSIVLDVLKGVLTGGLQGGFDAIEKHVVDLGKVFGLNLQPVIDWFNDTVVKQVIPTLKDWAKTFIDDWWPKIRDAAVFVWNKLSDLWNFISTKIWPPFKDFLGWLGEQFGKVGKSIGDTWENTIKPALSKFWDYVTNKLWPTLRDDVFPWIEKNVKPKLEAAFSIISEHIIPDLGSFVDLILNHVIPTLISWWGVLFSLVNPFLKTAGDLIGKVVDGLKDSKDPLKSTTDGFKGLADTLKGVFDFLSKVVGGFHTLWLLMGGWLVGPIFDYIGNLISMFGLVGDIVDKLQKGDIAGVAADAQKAIAIAKGQQIISGDGGQLQTSQQRLQQYMAAHPGYDPSAAGNMPAHAGGTSSAARGLALVGERGVELIKTVAGKLALVTGPTLMNMQGGERVYNAQQTRAMLPNPASAQQISNMYANSYGGSYSAVNSHNSNQNFNLNANMPVDLSNSLQRYYRQQQFLYGR